MGNIRKNCCAPAPYLYACQDIYFDYTENTLTSSQMGYDCMNLSSRNTPISYIGCICAFTSVVYS